MFARTIIEMMQALFRIKFDSPIYEYDKNFYCEVTEPNSWNLENFRYPEIMIRVWPNGKPPEKHGD